MSIYTQSIANVRARYERKVELEKRIAEQEEKIRQDREEFSDMLEALEYIGVVADANAERILDFITGAINGTLAKIFPYDKRSIKLDKSLYRNQYSHINLKLTVGEERKERSLSLSGTGLRQLISNLFTITLTEVRKGRRLVILDECYSGVHAVAKRIAADIMSIFAKDGFQFILVEYGMNDIGKIYLAEKKGDTSYLTEFQGKYTDDIIYADPDDEVLITSALSSSETESEYEEATQEYRGIVS